MIHFVIGTRAQLFKMAPIMLECERQKLQWRWIYTAQHKETIVPALKTFGLPDPDVTVVDWEIEAKTYAKMAKWLVHMLFSLFNSRKILAGETGRQHVLLTHGDTFTTWFGALYGRLTGTRVMHVESGLRSFNLFSPFPEEINRLITFSMSNYYACPGQWAVDNLKKYRGEKLNTLANTQLDTVRFGIGHQAAFLLDLPQEKYILVSIHRYENIFNLQRFTRIIDEIIHLSGRFRILFVMHPATLVQLDKTGLRERLECCDRINLLPRQEYLQFIGLVMHSEFVITDGGGNQEELSYLGKPTLLFRDETERQEGLGKTTVLSHLDGRIINEFVDNYASYCQAPQLTDISPSVLIVEFLKSHGHG